MNYFRIRDHIFSYFNKILGPNHSYMKWTMTCLFGTRHVKSSSDGYSNVPVVINMSDRGAAHVISCMSGGEVVSPLNVMQQFIELCVTTEPLSLLLAHAHSASTQRLQSIESILKRHDVGSMFIHP